jgi:hypothetical protein
MDATDHGHNKDHEPRLLGGKEGTHVALAAQVELGVGAQDEVGEAQVWSFRTMAKPTSPRWLATKIFAALLPKKDDPIVREREREEKTKTGWLSNKDDPR